MSEPIRTMDFSGRHADTDESPVRAASLLDQLRAELASDVDLPDVTLKVPHRPHLSVAYSTDMQFETLEKWRRAAKRRSTRPGIDDIDPVKLATIILGNQCRTIFLDGEPITNDGEPVTFASALILEMTGTADRSEAIRAFYGVDGHVLAASDRVVIGAGLMDEAPDADPPQT